jgi:iduronate 2-sulfatase
MNMQRFFWFALVSTAAMLIAPAGSPAATAGKKLNVLFIAVDDLRPELHCYGTAGVKSPHIDRLAGTGVLFSRVYCQIALCCPTRSSLLTGLRPDSTGVYHNALHFRKVVPDVITLPEQFKKHGYYAVGLGKVFHGGMDDPQSWSEPFHPPQGNEYQLPANQQLMRQSRAAAAKEQAAGKQAAWSAGPPTEAADVPDNAYPDGATAESALRVLQRIQDRPFFLAVGFLKPHLNFCAPKRYWDLYDPKDITLADNPFAPQGAPRAALHHSLELRVREGVPKNGPIPDDLARHLIHGYRACVSYIDAQVGRLLDEVDRLGLADNTIVILWGDHGWHLGEHALWGKATNYEVATRVPLILRAPGAKANGQACNALVEFVDIYPTLCELAGLPRPAHLEGCSFVPLLAEPGRPWKSAAFSQFPCPSLREWAGLPASQAMEAMFRPLLEESEHEWNPNAAKEDPRNTENEHIMGYSMRTDRYRFTRWIDRHDDNKLIAVELYDHLKDPAENVNLAADPANAALVQQLTEQFQRGWRGALPQ